MPPRQEQGQQSQQDPSTPIDLAMEQFQGIDTSTTRPGVKDEQCQWISGFFPLEPGNLRTLPDIGSSIYTAAAGGVALLNPSFQAGSVGSVSSTFLSVPFTGGSGSGAQGNFVTGGGSVSSVATVVVTANGSGYNVGDILSASPASIGGVQHFAATVSAINTITAFYFYNLGSTPYAAVFSSDGSLKQVQTNNGNVTSILGSNTLLNPSPTNQGITQIGSQYLVVVSNQPNGYWLWDGNLLYSPGGLGPEVTMENVGSGYTSVPAVGVSGGHGSGAQLTAFVNNAEVTSIAVVATGSGWLPGDEIEINIGPPSGGGSGASITAIMHSNGGGSGVSFTPNWTFAGTWNSVNWFDLTSITVNSGGSGYTGNTTVSLSGGNPSPLVTQGSIFPVIGGGGAITALNISGIIQYQQSFFPTISVNDPGYFDVSSVSVVAGGSNYTSNATITVSGGNVVTAAVCTPNESGGTITSVTVNSGGTYTSNTAPTLTVNDPAVTASASAVIFPFGIQGTAVESFQGRVWVFNGNVFNFTAPGSKYDFSTSDGGGSQQSSDSFLRVSYIQAVQTNGFLFVIGDSSMNYISGVQTTGTPPTTTFTNNNSDPEIGTPYPACVTTLGQDILIANSTGVFVSSGGAFIKRSEELDGVFNSVPNFNGQQLSAAKATIFGKRVWMLLVPIVDIVFGTTQNKLLMYNGKYWWASDQSVDLIFIQGQEINSTYTAWGTDGQHLYPLFQTASNNFTKYVRSKAWFDPGGYESSKTSARFWSVWLANSLSGSTNIIGHIESGGVDYTGNQYTSVSVVNFTGPINNNFYFTPPQAFGEQGIAFGFTLFTNAYDMSLVSAKIDSQMHDYRG